MKSPAAILMTALLACCVAARAEYRVEGNIGKGKLGAVSQIAIGANDTLCALEMNGKITVFNPDGTVASTLDTGLENTEALAVSADGSLYVLSTLTETKKVKSGARMRTVQVPVGVECGVFDAKGKKLKTMKLDQLKSARAARIVDGKLAVADLSARALVFHDVETGKETGRIKKGLRLCCGIFDFCEGPDNTVAISNLGAFKLQRYSLDGKLVSEFGKRGRGIDDFQGCCNPVSAAYLPNRGILTVEKDPTRIKVYDANGQNAVQIPGVEELVKGCSFIPVAVDSKGVIYLGAAEKGYIVKCVP
ncbi:NHL repeat-containing protein [Pontiella sulfatireligans]|uniref:Uncharacterized protein n=1 Tax=Pontiella sulfatireligans TaxID=2750658 RepID=A0A6C2UPY5_9BACT|nr:hypothetical protein [Pontiella sulfatireligans]VGO22268.1 hypothetical protein SCARR_04350 [Pontiella sulfatireligans]